MVISIENHVRNFYFKDIFILIFERVSKLHVFLLSLPLYEKFVVIQFISILKVSFMDDYNCFMSSFCDSGLSIDEFSRKKLDLTADELSEEKALAYSCLT